jgi:hypothetical protein
MNDGPGGCAKTFGDLSMLFTLRASQFSTPMPGQYSKLIDSLAALD